MTRRLAALQPLPTLIFGIRMALGAQPRDVLGDVLGRGMALTVTGLAVGIAAAFALARLVAAMLVNVSAADPLTFGGAMLFPAGAGQLPARAPGYQGRPDGRSAVRMTHCAGTAIGPGCPSRVALRATLQSTVH